MSASLTRRQALKAGAAAGITTLFAGPLGLAEAAASGTPRHLLRRTYLPLVGQRLTVGGQAFTLRAVEDLAGAVGTSRLRAHDQAFVVVLTGPAGALPAATYPVVHPRIGRVDLFVTPVGGGDRYEIVVDRSVGAPADPPAPTPGHQPPPERPGSPEAAAAAVTASVARQERKAVAQHQAIKRRKRAAAKRRAELTRRRRAALRRKRARAKAKARTKAVRARTRRRR